MDQLSLANTNNRNSDVTIVITTGKLALQVGTPTDARDFRITHHLRARIMNINDVIYHIAVVKNTYFLGFDSH